MYTPGIWQAFFLMIKMPTDVQQSGQSHVSRHFKWMERSRCERSRGSERRQPAPSNTSSSLSTVPCLLILDGRKMKDRRGEKKPKNVYGICIRNFISTCVGMRDFIPSKQPTWWGCYSPDSRIRYSHIWTGRMMGNVKCGSGITIRPWNVG